VRCIAPARAWWPPLARRYEYPADAEGRYGQAVVTAAFDVRRLRHESAIGRKLLANAAVACLDPQDRVYAPVGWRPIADASRSGDLRLDGDPAAASRLTHLLLALSPSQDRRVTNTAAN
jgi:hypothetical protein